MVITLCGENSFSLGHELNDLINSFKAKHSDLSIIRLDGEQVEFDRILAALTSLDLFSSDKLVVIRRPSHNKQFVEQFEELLALVSDSTELILIEPKLDKRTAFYKLVKSKTDFRQFEPLDQFKLANWLMTQAKVHGAELSQPDAQYLVQRVGADQLRLNNELNKLILYNLKITKDAINQLTEPSPQSSIFDLLEAAFRGDNKRTLNLYEEQRQQRIEPPQIIAMLSWQLHLLVLIKAALDKPLSEILADAKLNPYVVNKSQAITKTLSLAQLKSLTQTLLDIDLKSKTKRINLDDALQYYLLTLTS